MLNAAFGLNAFSVLRCFESILKISHFLIVFIKFSYQWGHVVRALLNCKTVYDASFFISETVIFKVENLGLFLWFHIDCSAIILNFLPCWEFAHLHKWCSAFFSSQQHLPNKFSFIWLLVRTWNQLKIIDLTG